MYKDYAQVVRGIRFHTESNVWIILYDSSKHNYDSVMERIRNREDIPRDGSIVVMTEKEFNTMTNNNNSDVIIIK